MRVAILGTGIMGAPMARNLAAAGAFVPSTGASTNAAPASAARAASRSPASIPTVLICAQTAPSPNASPSVIASTAGPSESIVTTTSAPSTASAAEHGVTVAGSASGCARSAVRL